MTRTRRGRRDTATAEATRRAIVAAALRLFAEHGFDAVSLRAIADAAGTAHGLLRHHFGAKEQLWRAVVERADADFSAGVRPALDQVTRLRDDDPAEALRLLLRAVTGTAVQHPEIVRLLANESVHGGERLGQILDRMAPLRGALAPIVERLHARGELADHTVESLFLLVVFSGAMPVALTALTAAVTGDDPLTRAFAQRQADALLRTLVPSASRVDGIPRS